MPKRLIAAIDAHAASLGLSRTAYLASLARADLIPVRIEPPVPSPPNTTVAKFVLRREIGRPCERMGRD